MNFYYFDLKLKYLNLNPLQGLYAIVSYFIAHYTMTTHTLTF